MRKTVILSLLAALIGDVAAGRGIDAADAERHAAHKVAAALEELERYACGGPAPY